MLVPGQRLKQPEFHRRYAAYPDDTKFELIGGIVYMASPLRWPHGTYDSQVNLVLALYASGTPGVEAGHNATTILSADNEPQPDLALRLLPEWGGQSRLNRGGYVVGAPELLAEIAYSSQDVDLNQKRIAYQGAGVLEYLVLCVDDQELHWFHFPSDRPVRPNRAGVLRSRVFPGLWIDRKALLAGDSTRLIATVQQGLASPEHARFLKRLEAARRKQGRG